MIEATVTKEAEVEDAGMAATIVRSGATSLGRTAGRASLVKAPGGLSLKDRPQGNTGLPLLPPPPRRNEDHHQDKGAGGFQEPRAIACILGGSQAPASKRIFK